LIAVDIMNVSRDSNEELKAQLKNLQLQCNLYDSGYETVFRLMAVILRVLFKQNPSPKSKTKSLAFQTGVVDSVCLLNSAIPKGATAFWRLGDGVCNQHILEGFSYAGLVAKQVTAMRAGECSFCYFPMCRHPSYDSYMRHIAEDKSRWISCDNWLKDVIFDDNHGIRLSREDLLWTVCEQDGGAHYDINITNNCYKSYNLYDSLKIRVNGDSVRFENTPVSATIRQISEEVLRSFAECENPLAG